ncbi:MAG: hypothetical protein WDN44_04260 [Sphingomonas sp.]
MTTLLKLLPLLAVVVILAGLILSGGPPVRRGAARALRPRRPHPRR